MMSTILRRAWLVGTNLCMMLGWFRVLLYFVTQYYHIRLVPRENTNSILREPICNDHFVPMLLLALQLSFLELFNAVFGMTRSKPMQVLLFATIRFGVETLVAPTLTSCPTHWSHLLTVIFWCLGDTIRFGCFFVDSMSSDGNRWAKYIRYTVGPILFPLGTLGEMLMVLTMANQTFPNKKFEAYAMYFAALILWPMGFFTLFMQLLRQRQKFLQNAPRVAADSDVKKSQ